MAMTRLTQRKFKAILFYVISWVVIALGINLLTQFSAGNGVDWGAIIFNLQLSLFLGIAHGVYDVVIQQDEMDHRQAHIALMIRSAFYLSCICANISLCFLVWGIDNSHEAELINERSLKNIIEAFKTPQCKVMVIELFLAAHVITFIRSVHKKFGTRVFVNTVLGKYQDPVEEDLVFMFVDLRNSTTIAEELGHVTYSNFIKDYYKLLSNCCEENKGEIYQFAGDGAFITWKISACRHKARPVNLFYDFAVCLERTQYKFMRKYGIAPQFKAGAHCGTVVATEVGNFGSQMAYHGDVLNTTSRIQDLCSKLGQEFLISEDLYTVMPKPLSHNYLAKREGSFELKGRKKEILVFSLQQPLTELSQ